MENKSLSFQNSKINYKIYGSGKPVMFIHGFGENSSIWEAQVNFLKDTFRLIVPDLPGSGESGMLQTENAGMTDYAEGIHAILQKENISEVTMIGHSMGGYITLAFAEKYPELLIAFGLFHSGAYADDAEKIATRKKAIKFIEQNGSMPFLETSIPGLFYDPEKSKNEINSIIKKGTAFLPEALIQYYNAMIIRPDRTSVLKTFPKPVLFIIGEHDKAIPFGHSLQQSHMPAHAYINILRCSAHMGMREETEKANSILAEFLHAL